MKPKQPCLFNGAHRNVWCIERLKRSSRHKRNAHWLWLFQDSQWPSANWQSIHSEWQGYCFSTIATSLVNSANLLSIVQLWCKGKTKVNFFIQQYVQYNIICFVLQKAFVPPKTENPDKIFPLPVFVLKHPKGIFHRHSPKQLHVHAIGNQY